MKRLEVVAGILWREGRYLAVERPKGARMAGWWEFPGGQIEPDEDPSQALARELREELGIEVEEWTFWRDLTHDYEAFSVHLYFFHVYSFDGEPQALEGQRFQWCDPVNAPQLKFLPADLPIVEALKSISA
ncbi:MAG: (deoxy)nucleoside triphosphate pyrophosphohydrolase [Proteobacteria bacterium]|nr:(deoxy)nucleoside triphosphate pyrophosphohydrolase [Pseudomonadota bacterium]